VNKLISDIELLKNEISKEEQNESPEKEDSDEAMKNNCGNSNFNIKKLKCTKGHNLYENSNRNEAQEEGLPLSQNKIEPRSQNKVSQDQEAPSDNWLQYGIRLCSRKEPSSSDGNDESASSSK
jgi:hypothetical protein